MLKLMATCGSLSTALEVRVLVLYIAILKLVIVLLIGDYGCSVSITKYAVSRYKFLLIYVTLKLCTLH